LRSFDHDPQVGLKAVVLPKSAAQQGLADGIDGDAGVAEASGLSSADDR
jgi:hypothetical protein